MNINFANVSDVIVQYCYLLLLFQPVNRCIHYLYTKVMNSRQTESLFNISLIIFPYFITLYYYIEIYLIFILQRSSSLLILIIILFQCIIDANN